MRVQIKKGLFGRRTVGYDCPRCNSALSSPLDDAGTNDSCPECGTTFLVPGVEDRDRFLREESETRERRSEKRELAREKKREAVKLKQVAAELNHPTDGTSDAPDIGGPPSPRGDEKRARRDWEKLIVAALAAVGLIAVIGGPAYYLGRNRPDRPNVDSVAESSATSLPLATDRGSASKTADINKRRIDDPWSDFIDVASPTDATGDPKPDDSADSARAGSTSTSAQSGDLTPERLFALGSPAVVKITAKNEDGEPISRGSGFLIAPTELRLSENQDKLTRSMLEHALGENKTPFRVAYVCTNYHVIEAAVDANIELSGGETSDAKTGGHPPILILAQDPQADIALLTVFYDASAEISTLRLSETIPQVGASVYAIGSPRGLDHTLSQGIISSVRTREGGTTWLQTTAPISPGSSGGPLLSLAGAVVGLTTESLVDGQNLNFAISCVDLRKLLQGTLKSEPLWLGKSYRREEGSIYGLMLGGGLYPDPADDAVLSSAAGLLRSSKYEETISVLTKDFKQSPGEFQYLISFMLGDAYGGLTYREWYANSGILTKEGNEGLKKLEAVVRASRNFAPTIRYLEECATLRPKLASTYAKLAFYHDLAGQFDDALADADRLVSAAPLCSEAYALRAKFYDKLAGGDDGRAKDYMQKLKSAAADYRRATELDPRKADNYWQLAQVLSGGLLEHESAIHAYERAIEEGVKAPWICYQGIAFAYAGLGNFDKAESNLRIALKEGLPKPIYDDALNRIRRKKRGVE